MMGCRAHPGILSAVNVARMLLAVALGLAACASSAPLVEQRTTQGPLADDVWAYLVLTMNGREPTFDERRHWESQLDLAISRYLVKDEEFASSPQVSTFRMLHQPVVGMSKEQVQVLARHPGQGQRGVDVSARLAVLLRRFTSRRHHPVSTAPLSAKGQGWSVPSWW